LSLAVGVATLFLAEVPGRWLVALGITLAAWLVLSHLVSLRLRYRHKGFAAAFADLGGKGRSYYGMLLAHLGIGMFIVGATMVSNFGVEKDIRMSPGDRYEVEGYTFVFEGVGTFRGPNYRADRGRFRVFQGEREVAFLEPEKRTYLVQTRPMTEAAIDPSLTRDLYVSLGEAVGGGDWALRIYYKPFVRWIWLGAIFMALGGLVAVSDRRYRPLKQTRERTAGASGAATAT
jgi:cytochrome c-type biogenesis protein CcmF